MFAWIQKLVDAVPGSYDPDIAVAQPGERVIGRLPIEIRKMFLASIYARERAKEMDEKHRQDHRDSKKDIGLSCMEANERSENLESRGFLLSAVVGMALADHFDLKHGADVQIRTEGVVVVEQLPMTLAQLLGLGRLGQEEIFSD